MWSNHVQSTISMSMLLTCHCCLWWELVDLVQCHLPRSPDASSYCWQPSLLHVYLITWVKDKASTKIHKSNLEHQLVNGTNFTFWVTVKLLQPGIQQTLLLRDVNAGLTCPDTTLRIPQLSRPSITSIQKKRFCGQRAWWTTSFLGISMQTHIFSIVHTFLRHPREPAKWKTQNRCQWSFKQEQRYGRPIPGTRTLWYRWEHRRIWNTNNRSRYRPGWKIFKETHRYWRRR